MLLARRVCVVIFVARKGDRDGGSRQRGGTAAAPVQANSGKYNFLSFYVQEVFYRNELMLLVRRICVVIFVARKGDSASGVAPRHGLHRFSFVYTESGPLGFRTVE